MAAGSLSGVGGGFVYRAIYHSPVGCFTLVLLRSRCVFSFSFCACRLIHALLFFARSTMSLFSGASLPASQPFFTPYTPRHTVYFLYPNALFFVLCVSLPLSLILLWEEFSLALGGCPDYWQRFCFLAFRQMTMPRECG